MMNNLADRYYRPDPLSVTDLDALPTGSVAIDSVYGRLGYRWDKTGDGWKLEGWQQGWPDGEAGLTTALFDYLFGAIYAPPAAR